MRIILTEVVYDPRSRDGTWCKAPYLGHKNGCPNYPTCIEKHPDFMDLNPTNYYWFAVIEEFDLSEHAKNMKEKHPEWTDRQCRNVLYWQNGVRKRLKEKAYRIYHPIVGDVLLTIPEANGINIFATMAKNGVFLKSNPDLVKKIMLVGKPSRLCAEVGREQ